MCSNETIALPDYQSIVKECIHEMQIKYERYGNTWLDQNDLYWKERLMNEVKEYCMANTIEAEKRKLFNIINIAALAKEVINNRGCRQHVVDFWIIASSENKKIMDNCKECKCKVYIENGLIREAS